MLTQIPYQEWHQNILKSFCHCCHFQTGWLPQFPLLEAKLSLVSSLNCSVVCNTLSALHIALCSCSLYPKCLPRFKKWWFNMLLKSHCKNIYSLVLSLYLKYTLIFFSPFSMKRTTNLSSKLMEFNLGTDKQTFLSKLIKSIFISYLENYIEVETGYLKSRSAMILQRYYDSKNHQKRSIGTGG